jgi:UDP-N-acetylglucosamine enolpyruvyl transferase
MIGRAYQLDRGFERIGDKLGQCGAQIDGLAG